MHCMHSQAFPKHRGIFWEMCCCVICVSLTQSETPWLSLGHIISFKIVTTIEYSALCMPGNQDTLSSSHCVFETCCRVQARALWHGSVGQGAFFQGWWCPKFNAWGHSGKKGETIPEVVLWSLYTVCDGCSWLSILLHLDLSKTQAVGHTCEGFFLIKSFEVGRATFSPYLRGEKI